MPTLTGIPVSFVPAELKEFAKSLDGNPLLQRAGASDLTNGVLSPEEVSSAMAHLDAFQPEQRAALQKWAELLGVSAATQPPVKKEWQDRERLMRHNGQDRAAQAMVSAGGFLFVASGEQGYQNLSRYDPKSDTWVAVPRPNDSLFHGRMKDVTLAGNGSALFALGGQDGRYVYPYVFHYDTAQKQWHHVGNITARVGPAAVGVGNKLFVIGGSTESNWGSTSGAHGFGKGASGIVEVMENGTVTRLPDLPAPRSLAGAVEHKGKIYVVGGVGADQQASNRIDIFDIASNAWEQARTIPTAVTNPSVFVQDGKIVVTGGRNKDGRVNGMVETFDPVTNTNGELPPLKAEDASWVHAAVVDGRLFALGSFPTDSQNAVAPWLREYAAKPGQQPQTVINVVTNNITQNVTQNNIDITVLLQHITHNVSVIEQTNTSIAVDASTNIGVLNAITTPGFTGCTDPEAGFFLRTQHAGKPLVHVAKDGSGQRYLVGASQDGKSACPKSAALTLFHPASGAKIPVQTDAKGQFAVALPAGLSGRAYLFGAGTGAAAIDVA